MRVLFVNIEHWQRLDANHFFFYTETMAGIDIGSIFDLLAYGLTKQKSSVSESIPTVADLEDAVQKLRASENSGSLEESVSEEARTPSATREKATSIASGCIPCSIGHLGTCSGLLNEAMRFARKDGVQSEEVINRVNMCLDELNALERVDLRPEMIHDLPDWEKPMAEKALDLSRSLRHDLEQVPDLSILEGISAKTQTTRNEIGKSWFKERFLRMTPEQQKSISNKPPEAALTLEEAKKVAAEEAQREVEKAWDSPEKK
jgi:hypothetical protein